jgi:hypothetical protein
MAKKKISQSSIPAGGEMLLYQADDGTPRVQCRFDEGTIWLTQAQIAELFQTSVPNVNIHLKDIYAEGEIDERATVKSYLIVRTEGSRTVSRAVLHYRLEAILAVGYRVRSPRGTQFRQWATAKLEEYLRKGFVLDDERLKNPPAPGIPDYFDELLERIRDIRASERRMYLRVREIFALAADYDPKDDEAQTFFQAAQNKLHFAVTGKTAPELIAERADSSKPNMGLTTWRGDVVRKGDVTVAKNYLKESEVTELNRIVTMFLDFAEDQARRRRQIFLRDWRERLDEFLRFNDRAVLAGAGRVSRDEAERKANGEYEQFAERRRTQLEADALKQLEEAAKKLPRKDK